MKGRIALTLLLLAVSFNVFASPTAQFSCPADQDPHTDRCTFIIFDADGHGQGGATVNEGAAPERFAVSGPDDEYCMSRTGSPDQDTCDRQTVEGYQDDRE